MGFAIAHLEDQTVLPSEEEAAAAEAATLVDLDLPIQDHQDHPDLKAHLEVVVEDVESPGAAVVALETQEHLSVTPIILLDLFNVMVMEELFANNVMVSHIIPILVIVN